MFLKPQCYNPSTDVVDSLSETTTLVLSVIADLCLLRPKSFTAEFVVLITDWRKDSKTMDKRLPREYYLVGKIEKLGVIDIHVVFTKLKFIPQYKYEADVVIRQLAKL